MSSFRPILGPPGAYIFFHWAKLHPTELRCTPLSYAAPYYAALYYTVRWQ